MFYPFKTNLKSRITALALCAMMSFSLAPAALAETAAPPAESAPSASSPSQEGGSPYVTAYTVTDRYGNEKQRMEVGEKARIIIAVIDPRFQRVEQLTLPNGQALTPNIKVVSTGTFASPSLGDISTTTLTSASVVPGVGLKYSIILNDISFLGGSSNELILDLSYNDSVTSLARISQGISQVGSGSKSESGKASSLIIKSASYGKGDVGAGENFTLTATIFLSGKNNGAENVSVSLTLPEEITVVSGSSYQFIGDLKPNTTMDVQFLLTASAVAKAGSYNITIDVNGNAGNDGSALNAKMPLTIPITQPDRFEISRADIPNNMVMGEESVGSVAVINKGKGSVYNVEVKLEGEGFTIDEGAHKFIGNVASGTQSSQEFSIKPTQTGTIQMKLTLNYEDEKAKVKTITKDFTVTVDEAQAQPSPGIDNIIDSAPVQEQGGFPILGWVIIVILLIAIIVVIIFIVKSKRKKAAATKLMEDDDEDF